MLLKEYNASQKIMLLGAKLQIVLDPNKIEKANITFMSSEHYCRHFDLEYVTEYILILKIEKMLMHQMT